MNSRRIIIGSRGSDLALWQANFLQSALAEQGVESEIKIITTQGDKIQHLSFDKMEGKGFFTKELEDALLKSEIDVAVHSYKDLETAGVPGLTIAASSYRANPADLLLIRKKAHANGELFALKKGAILGTSSARRKMLVRHFRPDIQLADLRGNVPTRVEKLRMGNYDAIILAKAGLDRLALDLSEFAMHIFDPKTFVPAPAQGVLAYQIREADAGLAKTLSALHDTEVAARIGVERRVLNLFHGGCQLPLGAYCEKHDGKFKLSAIVSRRWESPPATINLTGTQPEELAAEAVRLLNASLASFDIHQSR